MSCRNGRINRPPSPSWSQRIQADFDLVQARKLAPRLKPHWIRHGTAPTLFPSVVVPQRMRGEAAIATRRNQHHVREAEARASLWTVARSDSGRLASPPIGTNPGQRRVFEKATAHKLLRLSHLRAVSLLKRRARDSNPQPLTGRRISNAVASHSPTLHFHRLHSIWESAEVTSPVRAATDGLRLDPVV